MSTKHFTKLIVEGDYMAEVEVDLHYANEGWSPYLSLEDAYKLDDVREALKRRDLQTAAKFGKLFRLNPVAV